MATAILVDGGFFLRRFPHVYRDKDSSDPAVVAQTLFTMALQHLNQQDVRRELYRIFFYDCAPLTKKAHYPISKRAIDFARTDTARFRLNLHDQIRKLRKTVLRLGHLSDDSTWIIRPERMHELLRGRLAFENLTDSDFTFDTRQKGVDMRVGIDIASLAFKKQVDQIVLVAGDADFVPAAKLARREGIDFILDPMWNPIHPFLDEHIDGLRSTCPSPRQPGTPRPEG